MSGPPARHDQRNHPRFNEDIDDENNYSKSEIDDEHQHFLNILAAFHNYKKFGRNVIERKRKFFSELDKNYREMLPNFLPHLDKCQVAIEHNFEIIRLITSNSEHLFENVNPCTSPSEISTNSTKPKNLDMDKVQTTLKQICRDWSQAGSSERAQCYQPVLDELRTRLGGARRTAARVLVPGAGCGRLTYEVAKLGLSCEGNEWSLFMLLASNFLLNKCSVPNLFTLFPWALAFCNNHSNDDQLMAATFPDVDPSNVSRDVQYSMAAGDFLQVYRTPESWDAVACVFFIDTARNILEYVEAIHLILKPGGYWINLGPLLYHYCDLPGESSIELAWSELREIILRFGFVFLKEETGVECNYTQQSSSMLQYSYKCVFFVAQKPEIPPCPTV